MGTDIPAAVQCSNRKTVAVTQTHANRAGSLIILGGICYRLKSIRFLDFFNEFTILD